MIARTRGRLRLCVTLLILNLIFIWGNSLLPGSVSGALSHWLKELLSSIFPIDPGGDGGHGLLRKLAHFTEFCCLGLCLSWLLRMVRTRKWEHYVLPLLGGLLTACIDETIQCFVPERGPGILDVCIDTLGAAFGIFLLSTVYYFGNLSKISSEECKS